MPVLRNEKNMTATGFSVIQNSTLHFKLSIFSPNHAANKENRKKILQLDFSRQGMPVLGDCIPKSEARCFLPLSYKELDAIFLFFKAYFYCTYELSCILWMVYLPVYDVFYVHSINHSNDGCGNDNAAKKYYY